jgi:hypothetical protein
MGKCHDEPGPWSNYCILLVLVLSCFLFSLSVLALCDARERAATARYCFVYCCLGLALARIMSCLTLALGFVLVCVLSCLVCFRLGLGPVLSWFCL